MKTIHFTRDDLDLFSSASHDRNPLHLDDEYASRTPYGGRVVFGVLDGLKALALIRDRPGWVLSSLELEFFDTALLGVEYSVEATDTDPAEATVRVMDGRRPVLEAVVGSRRGTPTQSWEGNEWHAALSEPKVFTSAQLSIGQRVRGRYAPSLREFELLWTRLQFEQSRIGREQVAALMWASYVVGMELPGKRALFSRLRIEFHECRRTITPFDYEAEITEVSQLGELTVQATLTSGGTSWATVTLAAQVREDVVPLSTSSLEKIVGRSQSMTGKVALVTGASRGLGAAFVRVLALQGCTVVLNFMRNQSLAEQLRDSLAQAPGKVLLEAGDIGSMDWCQQAEKRIAAQLGRLDFLICNASPPLLPLWLEPSAAPRVTDYIQRSIAMVSSPMMFFLPLLANAKGWNVLISSTAVTQPHPHFPHYVAAKCAAEALVRSASTEYRTLTSLIVRPSRLLTDLTNTPSGRRGAMPAEYVAAEVLKRMEGVAAAGKVEVLDQFPVTY